MWPKATNVLGEVYIYIYIYHWRRKRGGGGGGTMGPVIMCVLVLTLAASLGTAIYFATVLKGWCLPFLVATPYYGESF